MRCPRCETVVMEEMDRSGITLDRCPSCRGIWLDRGELEKITARANTEFDERRDTRSYRDDEPPSSRRGHQRYKKSFWSDLFD